MNKRLRCVTCGFDIELKYKDLVDFINWGFEAIRTKKEMLEYLCNLVGITPEHSVREILDKER